MSGSRTGAGGRVDEKTRALASRLADARILFGKNSAKPIPGQDREIRDIGALALSIVDAAGRAGLSTRIEAVGHSAGSYRDAAGDSLSVERARAASLLVSGSEAALLPYLVARGAGSAEPVAHEASAEDAAQNRSASFTATFR